MTAMSADDRFPLRPRVAAPRAVLPADAGLPLHDATGSRRLEQLGAAAAPPHTLMQRAGLAIAKLALAIAPQARRVWIAAGPGNNGGDGLVAARHLHCHGLAVEVCLLGDPARLPADARDAWQQACDAGVAIGTALPARIAADLAIDALLGLGIARAPQGPIAEAIARLNAGDVPVLAVDLPSGLDGDTGQGPGAIVRADHTLSLLSLKPGLFTGRGRDQAGRIWHDALGVDLGAVPARATLLGADGPRALLPARSHAQHKGSFGDLLVLGGAPGMGGAALLAARAALTAGAGRVYLARLDGEAAAVDPLRPELMPRTPAQALQPAWLAQATVVAGCGGGDAVRAHLPLLLHHAARLVLDADALNAVAADAALRPLLRARAGRSRATVLTPHPLEAARLAGQDSARIQADRLAAAQALADDLGCSVLLKGSGTVLAAPGAAPALNPTGNARLGSAGSGDVLAGWLGGLWSQLGPDQGWAAACAAAWLHGRAAEAGDLRLPLRAADLIEAMAGALPR